MINPLCPFIAQDKTKELWNALQSRNLDKITELLHGATKELQESNDRYEKANAKVFYDYQEQVQPWQELEQNYDPSPYCQYCGAKQAKECDCGPICDHN